MPNKHSGFSGSNNGNSHKPNIKMPNSMRNKGQNEPKKTPNSNSNNSSNNQAKPQAAKSSTQSPNMRSGNSDLNNLSQKSQSDNQFNSPFSDLDKLRNHGPADLGSLGGENDGGSNSNAKSPFDQDENDKSDSDESSKDKSSENDSDDPNSDLDKDGKDGKNSDSDDPNSDLDQDTQDSDDEQDDSKNPLEKLMDKLKGPLAKKKGKHFSDFLKASKRKHRNENPGQKAKNLLQKLLRLLRRLWQLFKIYTEALRLFLLFKMLMLLQTLANWALSVLNMVITFVISLWTAAVTFFGTIGASILAFLMGGFVLIVAGLIAGALAWFSQWQQQQRAQQEYYQICVVQHGYKNPADDPANVKGGSGGAWTKKGTKAYKNAKGVFDAFIKHGFSGTAAAAVVGWIQSEGGFQLIDRAQGHYGTSEKENGIAYGVSPSPSGSGAGMYQFTPYWKFHKIGDKKWLNASLQTNFVLKCVKNGDWNNGYSGGLSIRQFAKSSGSPVPIWRGWDGYERGDEKAVTAPSTIAKKKADEKTAYKLFHGSKYSFNSSKFNKYMSGGKSNGGVTETNEAADTNSDDGKDPRCGKPKKDDDDGPSSSQIVNTAAKEVKAGKHVGGHKYWSWYGFNSRVEWCACFVSWVVHHTKGYEYVPKNASVANWASYLKSHHEYRSWKSKPKPGWIIMFNWGHTHNPTDHIGIVEKVKNGRVYTLEGNNDNSTKHSSYPLHGADIAGYGALKKK